MASSHHPDMTAEESNSSKSLNPNAPLLSVLRRDSSASAPTLQFESTAGLLDELEDSDDDMPRSGEKRSGRRKIKIEYIEDKSRRHITFSKRKAGIMKKAYELSTLTGTQVLLLVASETGHVYTFATPKLQPLITKQEGKNLIQACLNSPDHHPSTIPAEYLPSSSGNVVSNYDNELTEDDLAPRSASAMASSSASAAQLHAYLPTGTTPTPPAGTSAASVAAAAAQVFMNSGHSNSQYYAQPSNSGAYWNGSGNGSASGMYTPIPAKSAQPSQQIQQQQQSYSQQQQQQQQQQQLYHALLQQQYFFQNQNQQQQQQPQKNDENDA